MNPLELQPVVIFLVTQIPDQDITQIVEPQHILNQENLLGINQEELVDILLE
jgi:hypothetical protein